MPTEAPPLAPDNVVRLTDTLRREYRAQKCRHGAIVVDENNRKVECEQCKETLDPFEAICILADKASTYQMMYDQMRKDHKNLAEYVPHLRAVRSLESMWRGNQLPMCPHCKKGVTAEGLNRYGWVHKSYAAAVEAHEREGHSEAEIVSLQEPPDAT